MTVSAAWRLSPTPPALTLNRKMKCSDPAHQTLLDWRAACIPITIQFQMLAIQIKGACQTLQQDAAHTMPPEVRVILARWNGQFLGHTALVITWFVEVAHKVSTVGSGGSSIQSQPAPASPFQIVFDDVKCSGHGREQQHLPHRVQAHGQGASAVASPSSKQAGDVHLPQSPLHPLLPDAYLMFCLVQPDKDAIKHLHLAAELNLSCRI